MKSPYFTVVAAVGASAIILGGVYTYQLYQLEEENKALKKEKAGIEARVDKDKAAIGASIDTLRNQYSVLETQHTKLRGLLEKTYERLGDAHKALEEEKGKYAKLEQAVEDMRKKAEVKKGDFQKTKKNDTEEKDKAKLEKIAQGITLWDLSYERKGGVVESMSVTLHNLAREDVVTLERTLDTINNTNKLRKEENNILVLIYNKLLYDSDVGNDGAPYLKVTVSSGNAHISCALPGNNEVRLLSLVSRKLPVGEDYLTAVDALRNTLK